MKRPSLFRGILLAALLAGVTIPAGMALSWMLAPAMTLKALIALVATIAIVEASRASPAGPGRAVLTVGTAAALGYGVAFASAGHCAVVAVLLLWANRSIRRYSSMLPILADLGLTAFSIGAAGAVTVAGHSFAMALWVFFLLQALAVFIPRSISASPVTTRENPRDPFDSAHASAEAALRRIIGRVGSVG